MPACDISAPQNVTSDKITLCIMVQFFYFRIEIDNFGCFNQNYLKEVFEYVINRL